MQPLREKAPKRTCKKKYIKYRSYKKYLRGDFFRACGYCGDLDEWCGGTNAFHIDHFRPLNYFKALECDYANLVYACSYCNISKSDDWPCDDPIVTYKNGKGYVDPCEDDFVDHFERSDTGEILAKTDVGKYMFIQLNLGLRRHQLLWLIAKLYTQMLEVRELYKEQPGSAKATELCETLMRLFDEFAKYKGLLDTLI